MKTVSAIKSLLASLVVVTLFSLMSCHKGGNGLATMTHQDSLTFQRGNDWRDLDSLSQAIAAFDSVLTNVAYDQTQDWYLHLYSRQVILKLCNKQQGEAMQMALRGDSLARACGNTRREADFRYDLACCMDEHSKEKAIQYMEESIGMLTSLHDSALLVDIIDYRIDQLRLYSEAKKFEQILKEQPALTQNIEDWKQADPSNIESAEYRSFYANLYFVEAYANTGNMAEAQRLYRICENTPFGKADDGKEFLMDALVEMKRYSEAWNIITTIVEPQYRTKGDTILNENFLSMLERKYKCAQGMGDKNKIDLAGREFFAVKDSIELYHYKQEMQKLGEQYAIQQQAAKIETEKAKSSTRLVLLLSLAVIVAIMAGLCLYIHRCNKHLLHKNRMLAQRINDMLDAREQGKQAKEAACSASSPTDPEEPSVPDTSETITLAERNAVDRFIDALTTKNLFCDINFNKDQLLEELHIQKRGFTKAFEAVTGTSISHYVLDLRLVFSADLIRRHPEYTIEAIAQESGFSSRSTFYRNFSTRFGITPTEYRDLGGN